MIGVLLVISTLSNALRHAFLSVLKSLFLTIKIHRQCIPSPDSGSLLNPKDVWKHAIVPLQSDLWKSGLSVVFASWSFVACSSYMTSNCPTCLLCIWTESHTFTWFCRLVGFYVGDSFLSNNFEQPFIVSDGYSVVLRCYISMAGWRDWLKQLRARYLFETSTLNFYPSMISKENTTSTHNLSLYNPPFTLQLHSQLLKWTAFTVSVQGLYSDPWRKRIDSKQFSMIFKTWL